MMSEACGTSGAAGFILCGEPETTMRRLTAAAVAELVDGEVRGSPDATISSVASLERATSEALSFVARARYLPYLHTTRAGVVLVQEEWVRELPEGCTGVVVKDPHDAMQRVLARLHEPPERTPGIHPTAIVPESVVLGEAVAIGPYAVLGEGITIGDRVSIGAHAVIGAGCSIGNDVVIHPHATLYDGVFLGDRVVLHSGVRIGKEGFGYVWRDGGHRRVPHVGGCVIESDVEIGANSSVDRGSVGDTVIGAGAKIDSLVHVGHNVHLGRQAIAAALVGIAGSTSIGEGTVLGGQAGVGGHLQIGDRARIAARAGVIGDVPAGATYSGYPARPHRDALRAQAAAFRFPELLRRLKRLESSVLGEASEDHTERPESAPAE